MDTDSLTSQLQLIYSTFSLDQGTYKLTQELTNKFLMTQKTNDYILIPRLALWLASKQQQITAVDGSIVYGSGVTLNSIINDCQNKGISNIDYVLDTAITMLSELKIDQSCLRTLNTIKTNNSILNMFYSKMEATLQLFNLNDQGQIIKNISWLLFIIMKRQLNLIDVVQSTCLLISLLAIIISQLIHTTTNKNLLDLKKNASNEDEFQTLLLQYLISQYKIKDLELFNISNQQTKQLYFDLIKSNTIKQLKSNNGYSIFIVSIINSNQYKLDQHYKGLLKLDEFDERLIVPERQKNLTPKKLTPNIKSMNVKQLAMQSKCEQNREQQPQQNRYQKLLNYEIDSKITLSTNLREIKLPKTVLMSPYAQQSIVATPMTEAMEMYNWIHDKQQPLKKYFKNGDLSIASLNQANLLQNLSNQTKYFDLIDKTFNSLVEFCEDCNLVEQNTSKTNQYWTLYIYMLDKSNMQLEEQALKGLLCFCIECVHFILNKSSSMLDQLILKCEIQHYQVWKWLDFFLNQFDAKIPHQLKEHFLDLEVKYISYSIWSCDSQSELIKFLNEINLSRFQQNNSAMNRLFKRVLHYCAFQIQTVSAHLKLPEQTQEFIWITIKYIISEKTDHLRHHSLDQIVLAAIYAVIKLTGNQLKFQSIINSYEATNTWFTKQFIKKIVCNVYITNDSMGDIVSYYNSSFIPQIKQFMLQMSNEIRSNTVPQSPMNNKNPALTNKVLDSPLRDILPRPQSQSFQHAGLMTPSTQLLYAYQESPLLKQAPKVPQIPIQKENQNMQNRQIDYSQETQDFIMKKFEQLKTNKSKQINSKTSFSILQQGTPKIISSSRANSALLNNQTQNSQQSEQNSTFCKLLNFEQ